MESLDQEINQIKINPNNFNFFNLPITGARLQRLYKESREKEHGPIRYIVPPVRKENIIYVNDENKESKFLIKKIESRYDTTLDKIEAIKSKRSYNNTKSSFNPITTKHEGSLDKNSKSESYFIHNPRINQVDINEDLIEDINFEVNNMNYSKTKSSNFSLNKDPDKKIFSNKHKPITLSKTATNFNQRRPSPHFAHLPSLTEGEKNNINNRLLQNVESIISAPILIKYQKSKGTSSEDFIHDGYRYRKPKVNISEIFKQHNSQVRRDMHSTKISDYHMKKNVEFIARQKSLTYNKSLDSNVFKKSMNIVNFRNGGMNITSTKNWIEYESLA